MSASAYSLNRATFKQLYWACEFQQEDQLRDYTLRYPRVIYLFLTEVLRARHNGRSWEELQP